MKNTRAPVLCSQKTPGSRQEHRLRRACNAQKRRWLRACYWQTHKANSPPRIFHSSCFMSRSVALINTCFVIMGSVRLISYPSSSTSQLQCISPHPLLPCFPLTRVVTDARASTRASAAGDTGSRRGSPRARRASLCERVPLNGPAANARAWAVIERVTADTPCRGPVLRELRRGAAGRSWQPGGVNVAHRRWSRPSSPSQVPVATSRSPSRPSRSWPLPSQRPS